MLPWKWEENGSASPLLGIPIAETIAMRRFEALIVTKLESKLNKLQAFCLTLGAQIVVANGLVMGCLWFLLIMWAGEVSFLKKLQRLIDNFVWTGRSRVHHTIIALTPTEGGLGLISIINQYQALSGSLMLWVAMTEERPLQGILQNHISQVSQRRWGTPGLAWMVTNCRHLKMEGSPTWQSLCQNWENQRK